VTKGEGPDPYIVLGVGRHASAEEIARAYRRAARASHPDSGGAGSAEEFRAVSDAYDELRDPRRRAMYDGSHPIVRSERAGSPRGSVHYAAPGSQHVVLAPRAPREAAPCEPSLDEIREWFVRQNVGVEPLFRVTVSFLRWGW
jgi:curved DNA-binding protein CbpA